MSRLRPMFRFLEGSRRQAMLAVACAVAAAMALPGGLGAQEAAADRMLAIVGGFLVDGTGGPPVHDAVVLVEGERITHVGTVADTDVPDGAEVIDANGLTVMPGLTDAHVHLFIVGHGVYSDYFQRYRHEDDRMREMMAVSARQLIEAGVTSARDVGAEFEDALWIKEEVTSGRRPGPRLFVSGPFLQKSTGEIQAFFRWTVDGADDARAKTRRLAEAGVDVIKVIQLSALTPEERAAIAEEAERAGLPIAVHAWGPEEHMMAAAMGATTIEHLGGSPAQIGQFTDESVRTLAAEGVAVVPTLVVSMVYNLTERFPERLDHPRLREDLPEDVYDDVRASLEQPSRLGYFRGKRHITPHYFEMVQKLHDGGVVLGVGTDSGTPMNFHYESTWQEMQLLVDAGLSPATVIRMATRDNARMFGAGDEIGTIEPGKYADILLVRGNPLRDVSVLHPANLVQVLKGGKAVK